MSRIAAVAPVLPAFAYTQAEITAELAPLISALPGKRAVLERMHASSGIATPSASSGRSTTSSATAPCSLAVKAL